MPTGGDHGVAEIRGTAPAQRPLHFGDDGLFLGGIGQALGKLSFLARGVGNQLRQAGAGSGVGVGVLCDLQTFGPRARDQRQNIGRVPPIIRAGQFYMRHLYPNLRLTRDAENFLQRIGDLIAFIAHVAGINTTVGRNDLGQIDDLVGLGKRAGQINQPGGHAHRAVLHRLLHE